MKLVNLCGQHLNKFASHDMVMLSYFLVVPMKQLNCSVKEGGGGGEGGGHGLIMQIITHVVGVGVLLKIL